MALDVSGLVAALREETGAEIRFDHLHRALYATDAGMHRIVPALVVMPRSADDIAATVAKCQSFGIPIIARGAGTGLTGGCLGSGVILDLSRRLRGVSDFDAEARTVRVEPGVIPDELNARLAPHGLHFAPDLSTSNRATIGGMIANNACGAHSVYYGRTVDHIRGLDVTLPDGSTTGWRDGAPVNAAGERITAALRDIAERYGDEIELRFPKVLRKNGGYLLDRLVDRRGEGLVDADKPINAADIVCGSEGTLCVVHGATLQLTELPKSKTLVLIHFRELLESLGATPMILEHAPAAVELVDRLILRAALRDATVRDSCRFLDAAAEAILAVEFFGDTPAESEGKAEALAATLRSEHVGYETRILTGVAEQSGVWHMRKRGLGLLMSKPGDLQTHAFVEDSAVDPARLRDYIAEFQTILKEESAAEASFYAHASVGVIHVRPVLNLKTAEGAASMRRIADRASSLALSYGGAMTGEHGDGLVRSMWLEKMYGPKILRAFAEVKALFDPDSVFNPGKIVDPPDMTEHLRYGPDYRVSHSKTGASHPKTYLKFSNHGSMAGLAEMCSGVGDCRSRVSATMCPSYVATLDEKDTTRARANALREALSNRGILNGLDDAGLEEVFDLCVMCKACKTECPTGVDAAKLKVEWLAQRQLRYGSTRAERFLANVGEAAAFASRVPGLSNFALQSKVVRGFLERRYGLDRRVPPPRFAARTFRQWLKRHGTRRADDGDFLDRPAVVYLPDTWMNYYTPEVGVAAIRLIEAAGFRAICPAARCCGRPLISKGFLAEAAEHARFNLEKLAPFAARGLPILGSEPSCLSVYVDEYPELRPTRVAADVAVKIGTVESFLMGRMTNGAAAAFRKMGSRLKVHAHCHQRAVFGVEETVALLREGAGYEAVELNAGCCGMAGSFGHERSHYDVARAMGEHRLFPAVRSEPEVALGVTGFSCRHQVTHHVFDSGGMVSRPRHVLEYLADAVIGDAVAD